MVPEGIHTVLKEEGEGGGDQNPKSSKAKYEANTGISREVGGGGVYTKKIFHGMVWIFIWNMSIT